MAYYLETRTHLALQKDSPAVQAPFAEDNRMVQALAAIVPITRST
jgi:hypothetical protein